jgi:DNA-binding Lrp family transcriptional regulator
MSQPWQAQVFVKWNKKWPTKWAQSKTWDWLKEWPEVKTAWSTMGEWDFVMWVEASSPEGLEKFVCEKLWSTDWIEKTETHWAREVWNKKAA